jgi:hypothetical protein
MKAMRSLGWGVAALAVIGLWALASEDPQDVLEARWRDRVGLPWGGLPWPREVHRGSVLIATPVHVAGVVDPDSVGRRLGDMLGARFPATLQESTGVLPRDSVLRLEDASRAMPGRPLVDVHDMLRRSRTPVAIRTSYFQIGDTLQLTLVLNRWTRVGRVSRRPPARMLLRHVLRHVRRDGALGTSTTPVASVRVPGWGTPRGDSAAVDSLHAVIHRTLVAMRSCDADDQVPPVEFPLCWRDDDRVGFVSGYWSQRRLARRAAEGPPVRFGVESPESRALSAGLAAGRPVAVR